MKADECVCDVVGVFQIEDHTEIIQRSVDFSQRLRALLIYAPFRHSSINCALTWFCAFEDWYGILHMDRTIKLVRLLPYLHNRIRRHWIFDLIQIIN